jgi:hypothetical protein
MYVCNILSFKDVFLRNHEQIEWREISFIGVSRTAPLKIWHLGAW